MSKQRAKGTRWESELREMLRRIWPNADRAPLRGIHDHGDFINCGEDWLFEAKAVDSPRFLEWARTCRRKHHKWAVLWKGNRQTEQGQPLGMVSLDTLLYLVACEHRLAIADREARDVLHARYYGPSFEEEQDG